MGIDLILAAEALNPPLTGIGRYSLELARRLERHAAIDRVRYFAYGQWYASPVARLLGQAGADDNGPSTQAAHAPAAQRDLMPPWLAQLRRRLALSPLAVRAYHHAMPYLSAWRLRGNSQALFHAPNFFVPTRFAGRTIATVHDLSHLRHPQFHTQARVQYMNMALAPSLRHSDHVIVISEATRQEFLHFFPWYPAERVSAILLAADSAFAPHSPADVQRALARLQAQPCPLATASAVPTPLKPQGYALYVGTLEPRKNLARLLQAYERLPVPLRREYPLVIAGAKGWDCDALLQTMARAHHAGWLHYYDFVPQALLPPLYAGAALFVYPSLYEGFGLPVAEAMASGTPVVTSALSSMPEVAAGAARLVDPHDSEAIASAIAQALQDRAWRDSARALGLQRAAQLTWERTTAATIALYQQVMAAPKR